MKTRFLSILLFLMVLMPHAILAQSPTTTTIGDTTYSTNTHPFGNYYRGSWNQMLYSPAEVGQSGYITEIAYNCAYADTMTFADLRIYLGVTSDTMLEDITDFLPMSSLALVYTASNVLMGTHTGWYPFTLQSPYYYDATSGEHLVVVVAKYAPGWTYDLEWYYDDADYARTMNIQCDDEDRLCAQHPTEDSYYSWTNARPQMRLTMMPTISDICAAPTAISVGNVAAHTATIQWTASDGATEWEISCGPTGFHPDSTGADIVHIANLTATTHTLTNLMASTNYDIYVRSVCSATSKSAWRSIQVLTDCEYMTEFPYEEDFEDCNWYRLPPCWEKRVASVNYYPGAEGWHPRSGWKSLRFASEWVDSVQVVTLPPMQRIDTLQLSFFGISNGVASLQVGVMEGDDFVVVQDVTSQLGDTAYIYPLQSIDVDFANYHGNGTRIAMRALFSDLEDSEIAEIYVDDLVVGGNSTSAERRAFNVTLGETDGYVDFYAYSDNPYHYLYSGTSAQIDSGATLNIHVSCWSDVMITSATINGEPFLVCPFHADTTVTVVVTGHMNIAIAYSATLADLHVVALSHSPLSAGQDATISWTVRNDGTAATPNGVTWYDRLWISMECRVATEDDNPTFLGEFPNIRVLNPGEYYTQTQTVHIPDGVDGEKYLFAIADAHDCHTILWPDSNIAPIPCPAATGNFVIARSAHCTGDHCQNYSGSNVNEFIEMANGEDQHDNFFYDTVHIQPGPNPDLQVVNIIHPTTIYSGSHIEAYAMVTNAGDRASSYRHDLLYISNSPIFDSTAVYLDEAFHYVPAITGYMNFEYIWGRVPMYGMPALMPNETCLDSFDCTLPASVYGTAYFYFVLDATDASYEHAGEDNNVFRSDPVNILLSPYPDLTAIDLTAPAEISAADTMVIDYNLLNQGIGNTFLTPRTDRFFLTRAGGEPIEIGVTEYNYWSSLELAPEESFSYRKKLILPDYVDSGYYNLSVSVDDDDEVFEYLYEDNNVAVLPSPIHVTKPDLVVTQVLTEDTILLGATNRIAYTLENQGQGDVNNIRRTDRVVIARDQNGSDIRYYSDKRRTLLLQAGSAVTEEIEFRPERTIPEGHYYLFVHANEESDINELDHQNNLSGGVGVYLKRELLPDLQVTNIQPAASLQAGANVHVECDITNNGTADLNQADLTIRVSATNGLDTVRCSIVNYDPSCSDVTIAQQESQHFDCTVFVSPAANASYNQLLVEVDPHNDIRELDESNNVSSIPATIMPYPFDLSVQNVTATNYGLTGDSLSLSWTVRNQGSVPNSTYPLYVTEYGTVTDATEFADPEDPTHSMITLWRDGVYLSEDTQWDTNDILLGYAYSYHFPTPNSLYSETAHVQLPYRNWGSFFLLVKADDKSNTFDYDRGNNVWASPIQIDLGATPDLKITEMTFRRDNVERNQSHMLYYTVQNQGYGATPQDAWIDKFFLNTVACTDNERLVGYRHHIGALMPGESYQDSLEIQIPNYDMGSYTFTGLTDATDQVFEYNGEGNNIQDMPLYITLPPPSDLMPGQPSHPETALLDGRGLTINYPLYNAGPNYAYGKVKELVYLSEDNQWSSDDYLFDAETQTISIDAGSTEAMTAFSNSSGMAPGYYYVVVRSNAYNALNESSYSNNTVVSSQRIYIDYPTLVIGQPYTEDDVFKADRYFRFEVTEEQAGQTLLCQVSGVNLQGLFLSHGNTPTATRYAFYSGTPTAVNTTNYELIVPSLKAGTYYLLLNMGNVTGSSNTIHINTSIVNFDIISIDAASGANSGSLTARIRGAKFDTIMDFRLEQNGRYIPATKIHVQNSSDAYTTFDLTDETPGQYDVVAELEGGVIVTKNQAFTIEEGLPANLNARIEGPSTVRTGIIFQASVEYSNTGKTDVPIAGLMVVSRNGHPIAFSTDKLNEGATQLYIPIGEPNGNPDIIRPGHSGTRTLFVYPNSAAEVILDLYTVKAQ